MNRTLTHDISPDGPPVFEIASADWWVKILGMLQHNWALIEQGPNGSATVYFFHDQGTTKNRVAGYDFRSLRNRRAVVDSLNFSDEQKAQAALRNNGFERLAELDGPWNGEEPKGIFFDASATEPGIYPKGGYWQG